MLPAVATVVFLAPIAFLGSFVYGVTGFGAGLLTIPLASHFYEVPFVLAVFAVLDSVNAVRVCLAQPQAIVRAEAVRLVPCCVVGVLLGAVLILVLPAGVLMLALGTFVLAYALYSLIVSVASSRSLCPPSASVGPISQGCLGGSPPPCLGREARPMRSISACDPMGRSKYARPSL